MELHGASWQEDSLGWIPLPDKYRYLSGEAHVFFCPVPREVGESEWGHILPCGEIESLAPGAECKRRALLRETSSAMRSFVCGLCLGVAPGKVRFTRSPAGKPSVLVNDKAVPIHFSQSHTNACIVTAVYDMPCGVDVERMTDPLSYPQLSRRGFPEGWIRELDATKDKTRAVRLFTVYWTALESLFKLYGGHSLIGFLRELNLSSRDDAVQLRFEGVWGAYFEVDGEHLACLTLARRASRVRGFQLSAIDFQCPS